MPHLIFSRFPQHILNEIGIKDFAAASANLAFDLLHHTRIPAQPTFILVQFRINLGGS